MHVWTTAGPAIGTKRIGEQSYIVFKAANVDGRCDFLKNDNQYYMVNSMQVTVTSIRSAHQMILSSFNKKLACFYLKVQLVLP